MKKIVMCFLVCILLLAGAAYAEDQLLAQSGDLSLYFSEKYMAVYLTDMAGHTWYVLEPEGTQGNSTVKAMQKSTLYVSYITNEQTGNTGSMDSWSLSVNLKNTEYTLLENGVEVTYHIGDNTLIIDDLPKVIPVGIYTERMRPNWKDKEDKTFKDNYRVLSLTDEDGNALEYYVRVKDSGLGNLVIKSLYQLIYEKGGFTFEETDEYNALMDYERSTLPRLDVTVRYTLEDGDFVVTVPCDRLAFTENNEITAIDLLPYFMTAGPEEKGYFVVPDGSGALIRFNSNKKAATSYNSRIYGNDILLNAGTWRTETYNTTLPIYGMKTSNGSVLAVVEEGAPLATVMAELSGKTDEFNRILTRFNIREIERISLVGSDTVTTPRFTEDVYEGNITVRYLFLPPEATYVEMAHAYRDILLRKGDLTKKTPATDAPLYLELIGAVAKNRFFLGIPYASTVQGTTFARAETLVRTLNEAGVRNLQVLYSGIFRDGIKHSALTDGSLDCGMGGEKALKQLQAAVRETGGSLYPRIYLERAYTTHGFNRFTQASRTQDGEPAQVITFAEPIMKRKYTEISGWYISPHSLTDYVKKSLKKLAGYSFDGLYVSDLGSLLTPDYARNNQMSRTTALPVYQTALEMTSRSGDLLLSDPNAYAFRYASAVLDLPDNSNGYSITDEAIPLNQLVLSTCLPYTSESWNTRSSVGMTDFMLYAIETATAPRFTLSWENPSLFQNTGDMDYLSYFSTEASAWLKDGDGSIPALYREYNAFWQQIREADIVFHEISGQMRRVTWSNGVTVYLNYGDTASTLDTYTLAPHSYLVKEE